MTPKSVRTRVTALERTPTVRPRPTAGRSTTGRNASSVVKSKRAAHLPGEETRVDVEADRSGEGWRLVLAPVVDEDHPVDRARDPAHGVLERLRGVAHRHDDHQGVGTGSG